MAIVVVAALAAVGVFESDDASSDEAGPGVAGMCVEGHEDCVDTVVDGEGADQGLDQICEAGTEDCDDTPGSDGFEQTCLVGTEDCVDTPGEGFGEEPASDGN